MSARHVVVSLVVWYLMIPSDTTVSRLGNHLVVHTDWKLVSEFTSRHDCDVAMIKLRGRAYRDSLRFPQDKDAVPEFSAKCFDKDYAPSKSH